MNHPTWPMGPRSPMSRIALAVGDVLLDRVGVARGPHLEAHVERAAGDRPELVARPRVDELDVGVVELLLEKDLGDGVVELRAEPVVERHLDDRLVRRRSRSRRVRARGERERQERERGQDEPGRSQRFMNHPAPRAYPLSAERARADGARAVPLERELAARGGERGQGTKGLVRMRLGRRDSARIMTLALASVALASVAPSCSSGNATTSGDAPPVTIELAQSPWNASRLDAAIARLLLTTQLGVKVNVTEVDEHSQWAKIAAGTLHASLEVRPSGHRADIASYIATGQVGYAGPLGPIGKIGWYIPSYLLTVHPELARWEAFQTQATAEIFATGGTGAQGQFLAGDPSWTQYDADIIRNLPISFEVVYAGSEDAELAALDQAYEARAARS